MINDTLIGNSSLAFFLEQSVFPSPPPFELSFLSLETALFLQQCSNQDSDSLLDFVASMKFTRLSEAVSGFAASQNIHKRSLTLRLPLLALPLLPFLGGSEFGTAGVGFDRLLRLPPCDAAGV